MAVACGAPAAALLEECGQVLGEFELAAEYVTLTAGESRTIAPVVAAAAERDGIEVIIAISTGKLGLGTRLASHTALPVLMVPVDDTGKNGLASLQEAVKKPAAGSETAVFALGVAGARNAALFAVSILALKDEEIAARWTAFRKQQTGKVLAMKLP
jgi:5-(carboxyamino)imidazole ribonucleotide mutase